MGEQKEHNEDLIERVKSLRKSLEKMARGTEKDWKTAGWGYYGWWASNVTNELKSVQKVDAIVDTLTAQVRLKLVEMIGNHVKLKEDEATIHRLASEINAIFADMSHRYTDGAGNVVWASKEQMMETAAQLIRRLDQFIAAVQAEVDIEGKDEIVAKAIDAAIRDLKRRE